MCECPYACLSEVGFGGSGQGALECTTTKVCMGIGGKGKKESKEIQWIFSPSLIMICV